MRYFIYNTSTIHPKGTITASFSVSCKTFFSREEVINKTIAGIKKEYPDLQIVGEPVITFLYELTKEEFDIYNKQTDSNE